MIEQSINLAHKTEELLIVFQRDADHTEWTIQKLNELRGCVIKRDERGLAGILEEIQAEAQNYSANEQHRCRIREEMSNSIGCKPETLTLSVLKESIDEPLKTAIAELQKKLRTMAERLHKEYVSTVALLTDCARINSLLLKTIFERGRGNLVCYDSAGVTSRQSDASFMSMRL